MLLSFRALRLSFTLSVVVQLDLVLPSATRPPTLKHSSSSSSTQPLPSIPNSMSAASGSQLSLMDVDEKLPAKVLTSTFSVFTYVRLTLFMRCRLPKDHPLLIPFW